MSESDKSGKPELTHKKEVSQKEFYELIGPLDVTLLVSDHCRIVEFKLRYGPVIAKTIEDELGDEHFYI